MNSVEMKQELDELIVRFKRLKKSLQEEHLSPAQRAAASVAEQLKLNDGLDKSELMQNIKALMERRKSERLAQQLQKAGALGKDILVPRQPTSQEMERAAQNMWAQANGFATQEELEKAEANWGNKLNNWLLEASKPINSKFKSKEEEEAYWNSIKINSDSRGEGSGY